MPSVESYGIEPIPPELRTVGWRDLFAINFTFFLNPVMYVLGALAVLEGGLPLLWAMAAMVIGQALAFAALVVVGTPRCRRRAPRPGRHARHLRPARRARRSTSPYRVIAATYWFAAQALTAAFGIQAIVEAMGGGRPPLVPTGARRGGLPGGLAVLGFDVMRWLLRVVLPLSVISVAVIVGLYLATDDPRYELDRVLDSPDQQLTWIGFATFVSVMCGSSLTLVTNVADFCRYTPTRRDMQIGLVSSALLSAAVTTFVGGYAAAASGDTNPFVAVSRLTSNELLLVVLLAAIVVQTLAANLDERLHGRALAGEHGTAPRAAARDDPRRRGGGRRSRPSRRSSRRPRRWVTHLGNIAAPLTGVILADYLVRQAAADRRRRAVRSRRAATAT